MNTHLEYPPTPLTARSHAESVVQHLRETTGYDLNYTPASLQFVDEFIEQLRNTGRNGQDFIALFLDLGCYVGEVFINNLGGSWVNASDTEMRTVTRMPILLQFSGKNTGNPIGKVIKRFENGSVDSIPFFYEVFSKKVP